MTKQRRHTLSQSRLYKLGSKARLAAVLELPTLQALEALVASGKTSYRTYTESDGREIQYPLGAMAACHKRLAKLLGRIEVPSYVHSQKGCSYVTNAKTHANGMPVAKTDIAKYFPSTTFGHVQRFFEKDLKCPKDVAWYLSKLCTFDSHIPTGSKISNFLAFLANRPMFDRIYEYARSRGCVMTLLQDDILISGAAASKETLNHVLMEIRRSGLRASPKRRKTKTYPASSVKVLTGVAVKGTSISVPNRRRKLMAEAYSKAQKAKTEAQRAEAVLELRGRINEADQIDPSAVDPRYRRLVSL